MKPFGGAIGPLDIQTQSIDDCISELLSDDVRENIESVAPAGNLPIALIQAQKSTLSKIQNQMGRHKNIVFGRVDRERFINDSKEIWEKLSDLFLESEKTLNLSNFNQVLPSIKLQYSSAILNLLFTAAVYFREKSIIDQIETLNISNNDIPNSHIAFSLKPFFPALKVLIATGNKFDQPQNFNKVKNFKTILNDSEAPPSTSSSSKSEVQPSTPTISDSEIIQRLSPYIKRPAAPKLLVQKVYIPHDISKFPHIQLDPNEFPTNQFIAKFVTANWTRIHRIGAFYTPKAVFSIKKWEVRDNLIKDSRSILDRNLHSIPDSIFPDSNCQIIYTVSEIVSFINTVFPDGFQAHISSVQNKQVDNGFFSVILTGNIQFSQYVISFVRTLAITIFDDSYLILNDNILLYKIVC